MSSESLSWKDMEDGKDYLITIKARVKKWENEPSISLFKAHKGMPQIVLGHRELVDPEVVVKIEPAWWDE